MPPQPKKNPVHARHDTGTAVRHFAECSLPYAETIRRTMKTTFTHAKLV